jgi:SAM-dependent methyltransferase
VSDNVHAAARQGFERAADAYESGRPSYPPEAVGWLLRELRLGPGSETLELGAGTGKFTRLLAAAGVSVLAVEPVGGMRERLEAEVPEARALDGTAEAIPLADGSCGSAVVAQAFHWFDAPVAVAELARVLRPGGRVGLIWNVRDTEVAWVKQLGELMGPYAGDAPRYAHRAWRPAFDESTAFAPLVEATFRHVHVATPERVVDRVASTSFVAALTPEQRAPLLERVRELLASDPETRGRETVAFPYRVEAFYAERL